MIFFTDLDNTMIYSYKHDIGEHKRMVELYEGREISFITERTYELLQEAKEKFLIVPTTTRTNEQYGRINLGIGEFRYAMTCNGGVLLVDGEENEEWYRESLQMVAESREVVKEGIAWLTADRRRTFEVRWIKELFVFTKCQEPENVVEELRKVLDCSLVDVFCNGVKVYIVPKNLNKGRAVERFMEYIGKQRSFAAGDSEFDVSMLNVADVAVAPKQLGEKEKFGKNVRVASKEKVFSEEVLEYLLQYAE